MSSIPVWAPSDGTMDIYELDLMYIYQQMPAIDLCTENEDQSDSVDNITLDNISTKHESEHETVKRKTMIKTVLKYLTMEGCLPKN